MPKVNDNLNLGGDSEKQQEKDNKGIVADSPTPSEQPKEETPKEDKKPTVEDTPEIKEQKQKAEEIVGVKRTRYSAAIKCEQRRNQRTAY